MKVIIRLGLRGALLAMLSVPAVVHAQFTYTTNSDNTLTITGYTGPSGDVAIPSAINGLTVTSIGDFAFEGCTSLTNVTIPNSVTSIGNWAFQGCSNLTNITIPNSVASIGDYAFYFCSDLTNVVIPNSVTSIGNWAFQGCTSLTSIIIPTSVTNIGLGAFAICTSLTGITVNASNPVYSSAGGVLFDKNQTTLIQYPEGLSGSYTIPNSVTSIGECAFGICNVTVCTGVLGHENWWAFAGSSLTSIIIPTSVTNIEGGAFSGCAHLTNITLPNSVTSLGGNAFYGCTSLTNVTLPDSVTSIGEQAFIYCSSLTSITLPASLTNIGDNAFYGCADLTNVTLPNSVTSIGEEAFGYCTSLTSITIPSSMTNIGELTFVNCSCLTSITIPNGIISIGDCAFARTGLTSIVIPSSVISIGYAAFPGCLNLTSVFFTGNAPNPGSCMFCAPVITGSGPDPATVYYLPGTIGWGATYGDQPTALWPLSAMTVTANPSQGGSVTGGGTYLAGTNVQLVATAFSGWLFTGWSDGNTNNPYAITVPVTNATYTANFEAQYTYTTNSDNTLTITGYIGSDGRSATIPGSIGGLPVTSINGWIYTGCSNLTSVAIPAGVTNINGLAFNGCGTNLTTFTVDPSNAVFSSIDGILCDKNQTTILLCPSGKRGSYTIPGSITCIEDWAFAGSSLASITIPSNVTSIGSSAFQECASLTHVMMTNGLESIGDWAFFLCHSLPSVSIPASVTSIGSGAFAYCVDLTNILVDAASASYSSTNGVLFDKPQNTLIQYPAGCANVDYAIPTGVVTVGVNAFSGCASLMSVTMPDSVTSIGSYAFADCNWLSDVMLSASLTTIEDFTFANCVKLTNMTIPNSVTSIGSGAFAGCCLANVTIPAGVTSIGNTAFEECFFTLQGVYFQGNPPSLGSDVFAYDDGATAYYRAGTTGWGQTFGGLPTALWQVYVHVTVTGSPATGGTVAGGGIYAAGSNVTLRATTARNWVFTGWSDGATNNPHVVTAPATNVTYTANFLSLYTDATGSNTDYTWTIHDGAVIITRYMGPGGVVTIPDTLDSLPVTSIGYAAFDNCTAVTGVTIPNSVTNICDAAFYGCTGLTDIVLPSGLTRIGSFTFFRCLNLTSVTIPNSVTRIGGYAFAACVSLVSVTIPAQVTDIGEYAFAECYRLTDVYFCGPVPGLSDSVFASDTQATLYYLQGAAGWGPTMGGCPTAMQPIYAYTTSNGVVTITGYAGAGGNVTIPSTLNGLPVTRIGELAFFNCMSLTRVTIPASITNLADEAFAGCSNLTVVSFLGNAPALGSAVFANDLSATVSYLQGTTGWTTMFGGLQTVMQVLYVYTTNNGGITITRYVGSLAEVIIPSALDGLPVTGIGYAAFDNCTAVTGVTIPNSVTNICNAAFYNCTSLTNIVLPGGLTSIRDFTFYWCTSLTHVTIPDSVTSIGAYAFAACSSLNNLTIPAQITTIGTGAFGECCGLVNVVIPASVTGIGGEVFRDCVNLASVYFLGQAPTLWGQYLFVGDTQASVYYRPGALGFDTTFGGLPTAPWYSSVSPAFTATTAPKTGLRNLQLRLDGNFNVRSNSFSLNICGTSNVVTVLEACTNLANPVWFPVSVQTLSNGSASFDDVGWTNYPTLYYRVRAP